MDVQKITLRMCKALIVSYLVTMVMLLSASLALWKFDFSESVLRAIVIVLYILSAFAGGFYVGKKQKERKFLWGLLSGSLYFVILFLVTVLSGDFSGRIGTHFVTTFLMCALSGTLGGMIA